MENILDELVSVLSSLRFGPPVSHVYNPLVYARRNYLDYWQRFGRSDKEAVFLGMNPGPWGMVQTGVPFGDPGMVKTWLGIHGQVDQPEFAHPKRPVQGFSSPRSEVSGRRLWGWAENRFKLPERFFKRFWVGNYCPLVFMEESGRNRTPDKLPKSEQILLFKACDKALQQIVNRIKPKFMIGVGAFAAKRARSVLKSVDVTIGQITHPSPANPKANCGWQEVIEKELADLGIQI